MRSIYTILIVLFLANTTTISAQKFNSALDYLNFVSKEQKKITKSMWNYTKAIAHSNNDRSIRGKRKNLLKTVDRAIAKIKRAKGYDGDTFKNQVINHLSLNRNILNQDYGKVINMKEVAEQSYDLMEAYFLAKKLADEKMEESQNEYEINYYSFATKHKIRIVENETDLSKKMKISGEVFDHYDAMYLSFFKVKINETYLYNAIKSNDINAIQQNTNALNEYAKEGLENLDKIKLYKEDTSLKEINKTIFNHFIDVTENEIPKITNFLILNEDFNKIKKVLDNTPQRKRTQKQIDLYNKKVGELNDGVKTYNDTNAKITQESNALINKLNQVNSNFLAKHIPNE
ncbi:MAG: hypothetical protein ACPGU6_03985 [Tenacibaculum sp.]